MAAMFQPAPLTSPAHPREDEGLARRRLKTPIGAIEVAAGPRGLTRVRFLAGASADSAEPPGPARGGRTQDDRASERAVDAACRQIEEYLAGSRRAFRLPIDWTAVPSAFRRRILEATSRIPYGQVATYAAVAKAAGSPAAVRAAGGALGANPFPVVIPCHRVVAAGGNLGGFTGGLERKTALLALERGGRMTALRDRTG